MTVLVELGRATTHGQVLPLGVDDPVVAARAVRRALAAAGRHAAEVGTLVLASVDPIAPGVLAGFARRALGPHGEAVERRDIVRAGEDATALADRATADASTSNAPGAGLVIVVGLDADGTSEARCLGVGAAGRPGTAEAAG